MSLFVDTSIWYAAADSGDHSNSRAKAILRSGEALVTSDHVLVETWTLLHHKLGPDAAKWFGAIYETGPQLLKRSGLRI